MFIKGAHPLGRVVFIDSLGVGSCPTKTGIPVRALNSGTCKHDTEGVSDVF